LGVEIEDDPPAVGGIHSGRIGLDHLAARCGDDRLDRIARLISADLAGGRIRRREK